MYKRKSNHTILWDSTINEKYRLNQKWWHNVERTEGGEAYSEEEEGVESCKKVNDSI